MGKCHYNPPARSELHLDNCRAVNNLIFLIMPHLPYCHMPWPHPLSHTPFPHYMARSELNHGPSLTTRLDLSQATPSPSACAKIVARPCSLSHHVAGADQATSPSPAGPNRRCAAPWGPASPLQVLDLSHRLHLGCRWTESQPSIHLQGEKGRAELL